ncbi:MAG: hypothetical protein P8Y64_12365 [Gammaproteobacteria bacterium]
MNTIKQSTLLARQRLRLLGLLLISLHGLLWFSTPILVWPLALIHLGVFLTWQPLVNPRRSLRLSVLLFSTLVLVSLYLTLGDKMLVLWIVFLTALLAGQGLRELPDRWYHLIALAVLILELFTRGLPLAFDPALFTGQASQWVSVLLLVASAILLLPTAKPVRRGSLDFMYGILIVLVVVLVAVGGLLIMYLEGQGYLSALLKSLLGVAALLLTLALLGRLLGLTPSYALLWTRYLLNLGLPFEEWLGELSALAARPQMTAQRFADTALSKLTELPWVDGVAWRSQALSLEHGDTGGRGITLERDGILLTLFSRHRLSGAAQTHARLLLQLLWLLYAAKCREETLARQARLEAIHETGSKLTHDIKNLLQSLHGLTGIVQTAGPGQREQAFQLIEQQLPLLGERLQSTLNKLQTPTAGEDTVRVPLRDWWEALQARHHGRELEFVARLSVDTEVPEAVFDTAADNLIDNARRKRLTMPDLSIRVTLDADEHELRLTVCDSGAAVAPDIAAQLLHEPVDSANGLGVGLYQAGRLAARNGFDLRLAHNEPGHVCFGLRRRSDGDQGRRPA